MAVDRMQDVHPIDYQYVLGEQPAAEKLTGGVKQVDSAFSRVTKAIGDPWEYQDHGFLLSPQRLAQTSLSRFMGPSDYLSPSGGPWNEPVTSTIRVTLAAEKNTWSLGFPLVKLSNDITPNSNLAGTITPLVWGVDITELVISGSFTTEVSSLEDLNATGEFYIDYYSGTITTYEILSAGTTLEIDNIHMMGPGVPWGTSNVIPTWNETASLCTVTGPVAGTYTITLPTVTAGTRTTGSIVGAVTPDSVSNGVLFNTSTPNETAKYRLPYALTSALSAGEILPEGYVYLWDDITGRILPLLTFSYYDEYTLKCTTTGTGPTTGSNYRLFISGTSLAEGVNYALSVLRDNRHVGLSEGQDSGTVSYTSPLSHSYLDNLCTGEISSSETYINKYYFRKSSIPVNPHPQYLHRGGYDARDHTGNSSNAMRGWLTFTSQYDPFSLDYSGNLDETFGIRFGRGDAVPSISFAGGPDATYLRYPFDNTEVGAIDSSSGEQGATIYQAEAGTPLVLRGGSGNSYYSGAVLGFDVEDTGELNYIKLYPGLGGSVVPIIPVNQGQTMWGTSLGITPALTDIRTAFQSMREFRFRGVSKNNRSVLNREDSISASGPAAIAISGTIGTCTLSTQRITVTDLGPGYFGVGDTITVSGTVSNNGSHVITAIYPGSSATSYNPFDCILVVNGTIVADTSGGSVATTYTQFDDLFVSNAVVGADMFNVYGNAIFFSDTGDGRQTGLTDYGIDWWDEGDDTKKPAGIYYNGSGTGGGGFGAMKFSVVDYPISSPYSREVLSLGSYAGTTLETYVGDINLKAYITSNVYSEIQMGSDGDIDLKAHTASTTYSEIQMGSDGDSYWSVSAASTATASLDLSADGTTSITGTNRTIVGYSSNPAEDATYNTAVYINAGVGSNTSPADDGDMNPPTTVGELQIRALGKLNVSSKYEDVTIETVDASNFIYLVSEGIYIGDFGNTTAAVWSLPIFSTNVGAEEPVLVANNGRLGINTSSKKYKKDIEEITDVSWLYKLKPVNFKWKDESISTILNWGLIAEDTAEVIKEAGYEPTETSIVGYNANNEINSVRYTNFIGPLIKAIQDQKKEIDELRAELENKANKRTTTKKSK